MNKISFVVPLLNEEESLPFLAEAITKVMDREGLKFEIIFVDDGSRDNSFKVLGDLKEKQPDIIRVIRFSRNYGKAAGLSIGIKRAEGDIIITMDADLQDDPEAVPDMLRLIDEGWDVVSGWKKKRYDPVLSKNMPSKLFNFVTSMASGLKLHDFNCGFKCYRAEAAKSLEIYGERHRYLPALAFWNGYRVTEMPVTHHPRKFGKSKYGLNRFINGFLDLLTLMFLKKYMKNPLHLFGFVGFFILFVSLGVLGYFGVQWAMTGEMHIRPLTLLSVGGVITGIQFISLGLIGEMIANNGSRDNYTIREEL